jgi:uncharacterized membrane protein YjgN (DUF898 family)
MTTQSPTHVLSLGGPWGAQRPVRQPAAPAPHVASGPVEAVKLSWSQPDDLIGLSFANWFLRIVTLGVYHFWGKTEVRRRIWSAVRINGEPLTYTGTGRELGLGFMIVFGVVMLPLLLTGFAVALAFGPQSQIAQSLLSLGYGVVFVLMGVGAYRAQRYRLSRTNWRGIRGGMEGRTRSYVWLYVWTALLIPLTLGWILPWRQTKLQSKLVNDMRFGDRALVFDAKSGRLYKRFALLWIGALVLLNFTLGAFGGVMGPKITAARRWGQQYQPTVTELVIVGGIALLALLLYSIMSAWYRAGVMNHFAAHTRFEGAQFRGTATAWGLIGLAVGNFCLTVFSLGILTPVAQVRTARYTVENTELDGAIPLAAISQRPASGGKYGEGLAQAFDIDAF